MAAIHHGKPLPKQYQELLELHNALVFFLGQKPQPCQVAFGSFTFTVHPKEVRVLKTSELVVKPEPPEGVRISDQARRKTPLVLGLVCEEGTLAFTYYPGSTIIIQTTETLRIKYPTYEVTLTKQERAKVSE